MTDSATAYVLATDGLLYRNPVVSGPGWFVVFDGYDEPEIVLDASNKSPSEARLSAVSILELSGLSSVLSGPPRVMDRAYDPSGQDVRRSYCFWLTVTEPIPRDCLPSDSQGMTQPSHQDSDPVVMAFGQPWG